MFLMFAEEMKGVGKWQRGEQPFDACCGVGCQLRLPLFQPWDPLIK